MRFEEKRKNLAQSMNVCSWEQYLPQHPQLGGVLYGGLNTANRFFLYTARM